MRRCVMTGGGQLTPTEIDCGLQERYQQHGHNIVYVTIFDTGSVLGCTRCHTQVIVTVGRYGGWQLTNNRMDMPCRP